MYKNHDYDIHRSLIVRTPLRAWNTSFGEAELLALLNEPWFSEAIYVASPSLYKSCEEIVSGKELPPEKKKKIIQSLAKYYIRMTSRCTPFGLFASCSVAEWSDETKIVVTDRPRRRTRLDMFYLCRLVQELQQKPCIRKRLRFFPNSSIYFIGNEIRYIETIYKNDNRSYRISAVDNSDYTIDILSKAGAGLTMQQLSEYLLKYGVDMKEAEEFVENLVTAQLLVAEWEPAITGKEYMYQVMETLERLDAVEEIESIIQILRNIDRQLQALDNSGINEPARYKAVIELIKKLDVPFEEEKIFQVDAVQGIDEESTVDNSLQQSLYDAFYLFDSIAPYESNALLEQFKKRFKERYEDREVTLAAVMDTETGIGFGEINGTREESPLLEDLILPSGTGDELQTLTRWDRYWLKYLIKAQKENRYTIALSDKEVNDLRVEGPGWAPSISVTFRQAGHGKILVEHMGGSSAVNIAGRFTYAHAGIAGMVNEIVGTEENNNPEVIMAEIIHMPESRTGNILQHRACRQYEIPYLAKPAVDCCIQLNDLMVSVVKDKVVLRSKSLNKEIIPRLSNAHNYHTTDLPLYHFLCVVQTQHHRRGAAFRFGAAENYFRFLPRVEYKKCIIHPATWLLGKKDVERLAEVNEKELMGAFSIFNVNWNLPRYFVLVDGDNELLVDSSNHLLLQSFIRLIKNRQSVRLTEYTGGQGKDITDAQGGKYNAQFIACLVKNKSTYESVLPVQRPITDLPLTFFPGSEWLYVKLYCGFKTADRLLAELIAPLTNTWMRQGLIRKWFFIRYHDPQFHLRVRFLLDDAGSTGLLLQQLHEAVAAMNLSGIVPKIQCDTYEREAMRYGHDTMELSETIFCHDSISVTEFLPNAEDLRWLWAVRVMHELLQDFGLTDMQKLQFVQDRRDLYAREFGASTAIKKQLDKKYRVLSNKLYSFLHQPGEAALQLCLQRRRSALRPVIGLVEQIRGAGRLASIEDFLASHIHMMLNRVFITDGRLQEWILYDFLARHYQSVIARNSPRAQVGVD